MSDQNNIYEIRKVLSDYIAGDNPQFYGVNKMKLKMIPNGDWFRPDKGFKIHKLFYKKKI